MTTENPRPEKVAKVEEIRENLANSDAVVLTEYRGLNVPQQAELRSAVAKAGGNVKIYKNSLARIAADEAGVEIGDLLVGPTAIAFIGPDADGNPGDPAALAKALADFAKDNPALVLKGGVMDGAPVGAAEVEALSKLPSKETMLSQLAGLFAAPMSKMASLLQAPLQNFAGLVKALEEKGGGAEGAAAEPAESADAAAPADTSEGDTAPADDAEAAAADSSETSSDAAPAADDAEGTDAAGDNAEEAAADAVADDAATTETPNDDGAADSDAEGE